MPDFSITALRVNRNPFDPDTDWPKEAFHAAIAAYYGFSASEVHIKWKFGANFPADDDADAKWDSFARGCDRSRRYYRNGVYRGFTARSVIRDKGIELSFSCQSSEQIHSAGNTIREAHRSQSCK